MYRFGQLILEKMGQVFDISNLAQNLGTSGVHTPYMKISFKIGIKPENYFLAQTNVFHNGLKGHLKFLDSYSDLQDDGSLSLQLFSPAHLSLLPILAGPHTVRGVMCICGRKAHMPKLFPHLCKWRLLGLGENMYYMASLRRIDLGKKSARTLYAGLGYLRSGLWL